MDLTLFMRVILLLGSFLGLLLCGVQLAAEKHFSLSEIGQMRLFLHRMLPCGGFFLLIISLDPDGSSGILSPPVNYFIQDTSLLIFSSSVTVNAHNLIKQLYLGFEGTSSLPSLMFFINILYMLINTSVSYFVDIWILLSHNPRFRAWAYISVTVTTFLHITISTLTFNSLRSDVNKHKLHSEAGFLSHAILAEQKAEIGRQFPRQACYQFFLTVVIVVGLVYDVYMIERFLKMPVEGVEGVEGVRAESEVLTVLILWVYFLGCIVYSWIPVCGEEEFFYDEIA